MRIVIATDQDRNLEFYFINDQLMVWSDNPEQEDGMRIAYDTIVTAKPTATLLHVNIKFEGEPCAYGDSLADVVKEAMTKGVWQ